jgi:hypothetical protein
MPTQVGIHAFARDEERRGWPAFAGYDDWEQVFAGIAAKAPVV